MLDNTRSQLLEYLTKEENKAINLSAGAGASANIINSNETVQISNDDTSNISENISNTDFNIIKIKLTSAQYKQINDMKIRARYIIPTK
jgi:hypothetical protein